MDKNYDNRQGYDMTIQDIVTVLHAQVLCGEEKLSLPAKTACCSDLMSDVLAFVKDKTVLITGLINTHVVRTAEMLDITCIVFSRGKQPSKEILEMAEEADIAILATNMTTYTACGELYLKGLPGTKEKHGAQA